MTPHSDTASTIRFVSRCSVVVGEGLRWPALKAWIRAWDPFIDDEGLQCWARGLSLALADIDPRFRWSPESDTVTVPESCAGSDLDRCLREAIGRFAHLAMPGTDTR